MRDNNLLRAATIIALLPFLSCSSAGLQAERIDPPGATVQGAPVGIIEDAATLTEDNLFSDAVDAKIAAALSNKTDTRAALQNVQTALCDGKRPRVMPTYKVHLIIPKPPKGTPMDVAANARLEFIKSAREYLKNYFYNATLKTGRGDLAEGEFGTYFAATENKEINGRRYSLRGLTLALPVTFSESRKEVESYYSGLRLLPTKAMYSVAFPKEHMAILVPQVLTFVGVGWNRNDGSPLETNLGLVDTTTLSDFQGNMMLPTESNAECKPTSCRHTALDQPMQLGSLGREGRFTISNYGWKLNGLKSLYWGHSELSTSAPLYPMHASSMADLSAITKLFVLSLPKETICKIEFPNGGADGPDGHQHVDCATFGKDDESGVGAAAVHGWGYDDAGNFSGREAMAANDRIWERVLANQTSIKEAVQPDNSVQFELGLDLSLACQYMIPVSDLTAQ